MLLEHEGNYGLGMDAMETVCSWNTKDVMDRMLLQHAGHYGLCMDATVTVCSRNTKDVMDRMLLQHEGDYGLGMDVKVTVCSWNTKAIMVWAWMQWKPYALGTRKMLWTVCSCSTKDIMVCAWMQSQICHRTEGFSHMALSMANAGRLQPPCRVYECMRCKIEKPWVHYCRVSTLVIQSLRVSCVRCLSLDPVFLFSRTNPK